MRSESNTGFNFFAEFTSQELEQKYIESDFDRSRSYTRRSGTLGFSLIALYFFVDWIHFYTLPYAWAFLICRLTPSVVGIPAIIAAGRMKNQKLFALIVSGTELITFYSYLATLFLYKLDDVTLQCIYVAVFILIVFAIPNYGLHNLIVCLIIITSYFAAVFLTVRSYGRFLFIVQLFAISVSMFFSFFSFREVNILKRRQFLREMQLRELLNTDGLTNTMNRACFDTILAYYCHPIDPSTAKFSLVMFDIDDFKHINDTFGHDMGDQVLIKVANLIKSLIRRGDVFARYGGEEFMVILPNATLPMAASIAEKLRTQLESAFGEEIKVTASFGVTGYEEGDTVKKLINRVDNLMYQAKAAGKNRVFSD